MKATIIDIGAIVTGKNLTEIRQTLNSMLSVGGPRGLTATTENGTTIHVELYEGQDYIRTADGKKLY